MGHGREKFGLEAGVFFGEAPGRLQLLDQLFALHAGFFQLLNVILQALQRLAHLGSHAVERLRHASDFIVSRNLCLGIQIAATNRFSNLRKLLYGLDDLPRTEEYHDANDKDGRQGNYGSSERNRLGVLQCGCSWLLADDGIGQVTQAEALVRYERLDTIETHSLPILRGHIKDFALEHDRWVGVGDNRSGRVGQKYLQARSIGCFQVGNQVPNQVKAEVRQYDTAEIACLQVVKRQGNRQQWFSGL